jgi:hypothetical protein
MYFRVPLPGGVRGGLILRAQGAGLMVKGESFKDAMKWKGNWL